MTGTEPASPDTQPKDIVLSIGAIDPKNKSLRDYLRSNMLDGDEGGTITMGASALLDEVIDIVLLWMNDGREADDDD